MHRLEKEIEYARNQVAVKEYCSNISQIQKQSLSLFMEALLNKMESDLALQNKRSNDTLLYIAKVKLENGSITEYDFKQIELQSLNIQYTYDNATKNYIETQQRLLTFLDIESDSIDIVYPRFDLPIIIDVQSVFSYVKKNNPFLIQQEIQKLEAQKNLFATKRNSRFNGNINLNYGINQYAETFTDAYRHGNIRQSVIIGFQIPIFQWGINKNRVQIAENDYQANRIKRDKRILEFDNEIKEKVNSYNHSVKLWFTSEKAYKLSQEQYQMLVRKFTLGKVSVYELTSAQSDQNEAMKRYYSAIKDAYNSYFSLRTMALYDFKEKIELEKIFIDNKI